MQIFKDAVRRFNPVVNRPIWSEPPSTSKFQNGAPYSMEYVKGKEQRNQGGLNLSGVIKPDETTEFKWEMEVKRTGDAIDNDEIVHNGECVHVIRVYLVQCIREYKPELPEYAASWSVKFNSARKGVKVKVDLKTTGKIEFIIKHINEVIVLGQAIVIEHEVSNTLLRGGIPYSIVYTGEGTQYHPDCMLEGTADVNGAKFKWSLCIIYKGEAIEGSTMREILKNENCIFALRDRLIRLIKQNGFETNSNLNEWEISLDYPSLSDSNINFMRYPEGLFFTFTSIKNIIEIGRNPPIEHEITEKIVEVTDINVFNNKNGYHIPNGRVQRGDFRPITSNPNIYSYTFQMYVPKNIDTQRNLIPNIQERQDLLNRMVPNFEVANRTGDNRIGLFYDNPSLTKNGEQVQDISNYVFFISQIQSQETLQSGITENDLRGDDGSEGILDREKRGQ